MILSSLNYNFASLLDSDDAVAICAAEGEELKNLVSLVCEAGWGLIVAETPSDEHFVIARASGVHDGTLVGDTRRWNRKHGYRFLLKRSNERIPTPDENSLALPNGRTVEIRSTYTAAFGFGKAGLSGREPLPAGYVRL